MLILILVSDLILVVRINRVDDVLYRVVCEKVVELTKK